MWITLMHTTASAADTGQGRFVTSMARGGFTFDRLPAATHASMEAWRSTSISLGWKVRAGKALAKCATCCPVPLPISSTRPRGGSTRASTSRIGCLLRSGDGAVSRASMQRWYANARSRQLCKTRDRHLGSCLNHGTAYTVNPYSIDPAMKAPLFLEVARPLEESPQEAIPFATEGVQRFVWESRFGAILIEVADGDAFVNGHRVERFPRQQRPDSQS